MRADIVRFLVVALLAFCQGCSALDKTSSDESWYLGFSRPDYMEVWIEAAEFKDVNGNVSLSAGRGIPSGRSPSEYLGDPKGWPAKGGAGKGKYMFGYDLPKQIYVRWQSMVEPQTYEVVIDVDDKMRKAMRKQERVDCSVTKGLPTRNSVGLGLAPGGIVRVTLSGPCLDKVEVMRLTANIVEAGPYGGKLPNYRSLSPAAKEYIEKYGIPYESWR